MISRIYIVPKDQNVRGKLYKDAFNNLELSGTISNVVLLDSYLLSYKFSKSKLSQIAQILTNPIIENFSIDQISEELSKKCDCVIEIGYLPGVTDNVGNTTRETIMDLLHLKDESALAVYTSKVFLISSSLGSLTVEDKNKITISLYNPLIERVFVFENKKDKKTELPLKIPKVILNKRIPVIDVKLEVSEEELIKIGKEGIIDESGTRRGPLALDLGSMQVIAKHFKDLKRNPTDIELETFAQTWSEHCKHTIFANPIDDIKAGLYKTYIQGATNKIRAQKGNKDFCVSVFSDNSGGIVFDDEYIVTHKAETHNSPSALDPFGGAITGIVGVNRDAIGFGLGAKPVANTYGFCFGEPEDERSLFRDQNKKQKMLSPKRIMKGVIKGVNVGGNCSGIPTLSGFVKYDDRFRGKPLVFVGTVGIISKKTKSGKLSYEKNAKPGDYIVVIGGRVGADGIHGATFSSVTMDSTSPATAVQIGDPITQKKLSDAIVKEAIDMDLYNSITDNGAGGLSCSVAEMAKECGGAYVNLDKVPLKYPGLVPWEIWISESQERMTLAVPKSKWSKFAKLMKDRGVEATIIGKFTNTGKCVVEYKGRKILDLSMEFLHNGLPKNQLTTTPYIHTYSDPILPKGFSRTKVLEELLATKNISGFSFISEQYDHEVQASSVLKPLSGRGRINTDAQVFRPVLKSEKGVVLSSGVCPSYSDINTYHMASCALDTAVRNAVACGAKMSHLAIMDNFCWCSSNDKERLAELVDAVRACYDNAISYGTPFISGKDSMFNDFKGYNENGDKVVISVPPTLLISAISVMPDLYKTVSPEFKNNGDIIYLLGETDDELGASEYYKMLAKKENNNAIGNNVPKVILEKNLKTYLVLEKVIEKELIASSLSVTFGGLGIALAKASIGGMLGCRVSVKDLPGNVTSVDAKLFSESQGRILASVSPKNTASFEKIMQDIAFVKLGKVTKGEEFVITDKEKIVETKVKKLHSVYHSFSEKMKKL